MCRMYCSAVDIADINTTKHTHIPNIIITQSVLINLVFDIMCTVEWPARIVLRDWWNRVTWFSDTMSHGQGVFHIRYLAIILVQ